MISIFAAKREHACLACFLRLFEWAVLKQPVGMGPPLLLCACNRADRLHCTCASFYLALDRRYCQSIQKLLTEGKPQNSQLSRAAGPVEVLHPLSVSPLLLCPPPSSPLLLQLLPLLMHPQSLYWQ
jgi:hypothetical protein